MPKLIDIAGQKFAMLTARSHLGKGVWEFECECGSIKIAESSHVRKGKVLSCGCKRHSLRHGHTRGRRATRVFRAWEAMIQRCTNPRHKGFGDYGGRGITVCDRWRQFENFYADMGDPPEGYSIDRIDNNAGYLPGNCRWTTRFEQHNNKRNNHFVTCDDRTQTIGQWARELELTYNTVWCRVRDGKNIKTGKRP